MAAVEHEAIIHARISTDLLADLRTEAERGERTLSFVIRRRLMKGRHMHRDPQSLHTGSDLLAEIKDRLDEIRAHEVSPGVSTIEHELADLLNGSATITILGGAGCAGEHNSVVELARKLKAPIVHALRGKEHLEFDNPFDVGMTGLLGFASGYWAMKRCGSGRYCAWRWRWPEPC